MIRNCLCLLITILSISISNTQELVNYVNPFIGTGGHGHTFPGATLPFGMVQLSPDTRLTGWDGCSGYHYTDTLVYGFSHTHLSGTGVSDYGDILLMPYTGKTNYNNGFDGQEGYCSSFKKQNEFAEPAYYKTYLDDYNISVELSCTERTGIHKYQYPVDEDRKIMLDLTHRDEVLISELKQENEYTISGYRYSKAWAENQKIHFIIVFSQAIQSSEFYVNDTILESKYANSKNIKASFNFGKTAEPLLVKVGISAVDVEGAKRNLSEESTDWDFEKIKTEGQKKWNTELSKIIIEDTDEDKKTIFYTALYHTMIAPNLYMDVDGRYRGTDDNIHFSKDYDHYTIFSLWDTYRATHPLYTIIDQKRTNDFIRTFLSQYSQGGKLPMWELANNYTGCMIGYHAVPVISDAYMKGIREYDAELALESMVNSASANYLGIDYYANNGLLNVETEAECVSKTLEYAYDDWTIAQMAKSMGNDSLANIFYQRSQNYKNVLDPSTGFMRARLNNRWFHPFDPAEVNYNYTEANAWQYSFYAPHDVNGWINLLGGPEKLEEKLDALFSANVETSGRHQVDITGLIGQYAHGNEPSHHIAYLYQYINRSDKTEKYVRKILEEQYSNAPDGLSGNEDCGQMSAWLVMSALGFYPVTPGSNEYIIGAPWFDNATIHLENGNSFSIKADNQSDENCFVDELIMNGKKTKQRFLKHSAIMDGGILNFRLTSKPPAYTTTVTGNHLPKSNIGGTEVVAVPAVEYGDRTFIDSTIIALNCITHNAVIKYKLNDHPSLEYKEPFVIYDNTRLEVWAEKQGAITSPRAESEFFKMPKNRTIFLSTDYASHYAAGGDKALIDMVKGGGDYRTGTWQGYEGVDIKAIISYEEIRHIDSISIGFLQDENAWIFMPTELSFLVSTDGVSYDTIGVLKNHISPKEKGVIINNFSVNVNTKAKYIKVIAKNRGVCPPYHKGAGGKCWIFADEITIN